MDIQLEICPYKNYIYAKHNYLQLDFQTAVGIMKKIALACQEHQLDKVLIDAQNFVREGSTLDFYKFSVFLLEIGLARTRIAVVPNRSSMINEDTEFMETVAVNRGANFRFFPTLEEAYTWLEVDNR
ncbi:MAG: hypothetical protein HN413_11590 [Chloroflexi bacterium]|jgi:hypothetical protein|nr:hypothetical protein [Chloroflexota bacterium]